MAHTYAAVSEKNNILWHPYTEDLKIPCSNLAITAVPQYPRGIGSRTRLTYQNQVPYKNAQYWHVTGHSLLCKCCVNSCQHMSKFKFCFLALPGIFFPNIFDPWLIEFTDAESVDTGGQL